MRNYLLLSILVLGLGGCKKEAANKLDFSNYTATDGNCNIVGIIDSTDWTKDNSWTAQETTLLSFADTLHSVDTLTGYIEVSPPCPNPNNGVFILGVNSEYASKMKIAIVNTDMELLHYTSVLFTGGVTWIPFDFRNNSSFHKNAAYRIYYNFSNAADSIYYKGHGDFQIE